MGKQIVVSEGKVIAYGEDCFSVTNDTVKCANTGNIYHNATVVNVDSLPDDIDCMCYKYDFGQFRCDVSRPRYYKKAVTLPYNVKTEVMKIPNYDKGRHIVWYYTESSFVASGAHAGCWLMLDKHNHQYWTALGGSHSLCLWLAEDGTITASSSNPNTGTAGTFIICVVEGNIMQYEG